MEQALRILMLEDSVTDAEVIENVLREAGIEFSSRRVETRDDFVRGLDELDPDVLLIDYRLPAFDGLSAIEIAAERRPQTPAIVVTGTLGDELAAALLRKGAKDYILKDRLSRLPEAVRRAIGHARAEAARREAEERHRTIFAMARDGIVLVDCETGKIADCNPEFERQTGRAAEQLRSLAIWDLRPPENAEAARALFLEIREKGEGESAQFAFRRPDGSDVDIAFRSKVISVQGRRYVQSMCRDVTEELKAERRLREQLEELRRFQAVAVERELRIHELREENRRLRENLRLSAGAIDVRT